MKGYAMMVYKRDERFSNRLTSVTYVRYISVGHGLSFITERGTNRSQRARMVDRRPVDDGSVAKREARRREETYGERRKRTAKRIARHLRDRSIREGRSSFEQEYLILLFSRFEYKSRYEKRRRENDVMSMTNRMIAKLASYAPIFSLPSFFFTSFMRNSSEYRGRITRSKSRRNFVGTIVKEIVRYRSSSWRCEEKGREREEN